ncbi:transglycosylase domain-containing protein [Amycolatopsis alkalitolerans]|uniref:Penicillin-binding protein n=1 Tax=Amycolatopsis alkalitolerans TaxID=2547244 RepID=A0A5C4LS29_9PSEU|nr:transglycosylase domain-containing protein [Amycolatopsis alkalitolerans]TNC20068.1 penicillin-binding protein [Amycolatopsis alkalitolerans]
MLLGLGLFGPVVAFVIAYMVVSVPDPTALAAQLNQPVTLYYADGSPMYTKGSASGHQLATWDQIPQSMKNAQMAAEDETFMTNSGFDLKAILRTVVNRLSGGTGGGSTIGQEYVKKATGNDQDTLSRKFLEMVESYKMTRTYSKQDILTAYLNTVYFGRSAYGIKAAARAYYGEDVSQLTNEQAAVLAGLVQLPGYGNSPTYQQQRYKYVIGRMLANHWISQTEFDAARFPAPIPETTTDGSGRPLAPARKYIVSAVFGELNRKGLSQQQLAKSGAKIYTTIQPPAQTDAEASVDKIMAADKQYPQEGAALVSVDPRTGGIIAYYGGDGSTAYDLAMTPQQPGSSFKPYVFAAALQHDPTTIGLDTVYNGSDNQTIDGQLVHNSDGEGAPQITVKDAMTKSVNTVFYQMGAQVGVDNVRQAAWAAGIPKQITSSLGSTYDSLQDDDPKTGKGNGTTELGISIGQYQVRPIDQAQGYATFANNGMYVPVHFVTKVTGNDGTQLYQFDTAAKPAFSSDPTTNATIARTVTESMTDVASSSRDGLTGGRPNASKTGTAQFKDSGHNSEAWMVGYTPQAVTSVWFGNKQQPAPIYGNYHNGIGSNHGYDVYGREEPGYIWQDFMNTYLAGKPAEPFPNVPTISDAPPTTTSPPPPTTTTPPTPTDTPTTDTPTPTESASRTRRSSSSPTPVPCVLGCPSTAPSRVGGG